MSKKTKRRRLGADDRFEFVWGQKGFAAAGEGLRYVPWAVAAFVAVSLISLTLFGLLALTTKQYGPGLFLLISALQK